MNTIFSRDLVGTFSDLYAFLEEYENFDTLLVIQIIYTRCGC
jgi:hypothetical protein